MDTFDAINQRRSVKAFDPTHRFTAAEGRSTGPVGSRGAKPLRVIDRLAEPGNTGVGFRWWPE
jgi:hypothetical protein